jgi:hypothetical protein
MFDGALHLRKTWDYNATEKRRGSQREIPHAPADLTAPIGNYITLPINISPVELAAVMTFHDPVVLFL